MKMPNWSYLLNGTTNWYKILGVVVRFSLESLSLVAIDSKFWEYNHKPCSIQRTHKNLLFTMVVHSHLNEVHARKTQTFVYIIKHGLIVYCLKQYSINFSLSLSGLKINNFNWGPLGPLHRDFWGPKANLEGHEHKYLQH